MPRQAMPRRGARSSRRSEVQRWRSLKPSARSVRFPLSRGGSLRFRKRSGCCKQLGRFSFWGRASVLWCSSSPVFLSVWSLPAPWSSLARDGFDATVSSTDSPCDGSHFLRFSTACEKPSSRRFSHADTALPSGPGVRRHDTLCIGRHCAPERKLANAWMRAPLSSSHGSLLRGWGRSDRRGAPRVGQLSRRSLAASGPDDRAGGWASGPRPRSIGSPGAILVSCRSFGRPGPDGEPSRRGGRLDLAGGEPIMSRFWFGGRALSAADPRRDQRSRETRTRRDMSEFCSMSSKLRAAP